MNELQEKLAKQVKITTTMLILGIFVFIMFIATMVAVTGSAEVAGLIMYGISGIGGFVWFVFWIISIVNAVRINTLVNGEAVMLIAFSVFTFGFANLIIAVMTKNKLATFSGSSTTRTKVYGSVQSNNSEEAKLKQAFVDGVISSKEYEAKKAKLKKED